MLKCIQYSDRLRDEWDHLALTYGTIFHTTAIRQILLESFKYQCGYHAVVDGENRIEALLPMITGRNLSGKRVGVSLPFVNYLDICASSEEATDFVMQSLPAIQRNLSLSGIELRFKDRQIDSPAWRSCRNNVTFVLPLLADEEATLAQTSGSCRNHVRKTYKNDWFVASFDRSRLADFYKVYVRRMKQLGSPAPSLDFFAAFFRHLPANSFLLTVLNKATEQVVGGMLLLTSPGNSTLYYPYGANLVEYNHRYLNNFMYWEAARFGIRQGMKFLDLGRSPAESGTYQFKQQWGAKPVPLQYLYSQGETSGSGPPDRDRLRFFIGLWKKTPDFITEPVGRRLIRYVMP